MHAYARTHSKRLLREWEADTHPDAPYLMLSPWDYMLHAPCPWIPEYEREDYFTYDDALPWWIQERRETNGNISYIVS